MPASTIPPAGGSCASRSPAPRRYPWRDSAWGGSALAQERLSEDAPQAQALSYVHDASTVAHPSYQSGANCANCQLYQGEPGSQWGPCPIFRGRLVNADGWCSFWVKASGRVEQARRGRRRADRMEHHPAETESPAPQVTSPR